MDRVKLIFHCKPYAPKQPSLHSQLKRKAPDPDQGQVIFQVQNLETLEPLDLGDLLAASTALPHAVALSSDTALSHNVLHLRVHLHYIWRLTGGDLCCAVLCCAVLCCDSVC